jgi:hypothetical protein
MRQSITSLIVVLLLQLLLALGLLVRHDPLAGAKSDTPLLQAGMAKSADQIVIESKPAPSAAATPAASPAASTPGAPAAASSGAPAPQPTRIVLLKKDTGWVLADSFDAPADSPKVNALLDRLAALKRGLPIATSEPALRRFKVVDADFERRLVLSAAGKALGTVYFGSSPGLRKSDARTAADSAVYAVDLPTYELPTDLAAWLDAGLLKGDAGGLTEIDIAGAQPSDSIQLVRQKGAEKQPDSWNDPALKADQRIDPSHAESLVQDLSEVRIEGVLGTAVDAAWQQEHPALRLTLKDEKAQNVQWTLSKPGTGDFYVLKSSAHPWYFSISASAGKRLIEASGRGALIVAAKPDVAAPGKS